MTKNGGFRLLSKILPIVVLRMLVFKMEYVKTKISFK